MIRLIPKGKFLSHKISYRKFCHQIKNYKFFGIPIKESSCENKFDIPDEPLYEKKDDNKCIRIFVDEPGENYFHPVTPFEIAEKLQEIPSEFLRDLKAIRLCSISRKKKIFYRFGMYVGDNVCLYPFSDTLKLSISKKKLKPSITIEFEKFGGKWIFENGYWYLQFDRESVKNFYLNNVLIHEIAHHYDRESKEKDREYFADNFVIQFNKGEFSNKFDRKKIKTKIIFIKK